MIKFAILLGLSLAVNALVIPAGDSRIYYTEHNWYKDQSGYLETVNPGAYIKVAFNGSSIGITLDKSLLDKPFCTLAWSIDDGPEQDQMLPVSSDYINLASGLKSGSTHSLYLFVKNADSYDRWNNPDQRIKIMSVTIDDDATLFAPKLAPKRLLAYWDSIGEGCSVNGNVGGLQSNDAHVTWAFSLALALNAELSLAAWSAQGYTLPGVGNIPPLWSSSGSPSDSTWNWLSSKYPRTFEVCPDYIINGHGTNDASRGKPDQVFTNVVGWLKDMRKTCQQSRIFLTVPFGRFMEDTIVKAYQSYQSAASDPLTSLIQLGDQASPGLQNGGPSFAAVDGLHPWAWKSSQLGALLAAKIVPLLKKSNLA